MHQAIFDSTRNPPKLASINAVIVWYVYQIRRRSDDRSYVGVTQRPIEVRKTLHLYFARRPNHNHRRGGLGEAIREAERSGLVPAEEFEISLLETCTDPELARSLESQWIAKLNTAFPNGFNLAKGGASLGGPGNARPVTISRPGGEPAKFQSIMAAVGALNSQRQSNGDSTLGLGTVYARLQSGQSPRAALGLVRRLDGRRRRAAAFRFSGKAHIALRTASQRTGIHIDTLRSRLHRAKRAGYPGADIAMDRRCPGFPRRYGAATGRQPPMSLPHPFDEAKAPVSAAEFARMTNLPKSSVTYRFNLIRDGNFGDPSQLQREQLLSLLTSEQERRIVIALPVPDGRTLRAGVRELIRYVLSSPSLLAVRKENLGMSAIRARLRRLQGWPSSLQGADVAWAFGFNPRQG